MLRAYRQKYDLTLQELASDMAISVTRLHRLESGKGYTGDTLRLVMDWLVAS